MEAPTSSTVPEEITYTPAQLIQYIKKHQGPYPHDDRYDLFSYLPVPFKCPTCNTATIPPAEAYSFVKKWNTFTSVKKAQEYATQMIKEQHADNSVKFFVGREATFTPVTNREEYAQKVEKVVDEEEEAPDRFREGTDHEQQKQDTKSREIQQQHQKLVADVKKDIDKMSMDFYLECRQKKGQLLTFLEHCDMKKKEAVRGIKKVNKELQAIEAKHPEYDSQYHKKYFDARHAAGIGDDEPDPTCLMENRPHYDTYTIDEMKERIAEDKKKDEEAVRLFREKKAKARLEEIPEKIPEGAAVEEDPKGKGKIES